MRKGKLRRIMKNKKGKIDRKNGRTKEKKDIGNMNCIKMGPSS